MFFNKKTLEFDFPIISKSLAPDGNDEDEEVEDKNWILMLKKNFTRGDPS